LLLHRTTYSYHWRMVFHQQSINTHCLVQKSARLLPPSPWAGMNQSSNHTWLRRLEISIWLFYLITHIYIQPVKVVSSVRCHICERSWLIFAKDGGAICWQEFCLEPSCGHFICWKCNEDNWWISPNLVGMLVWSPL
jgi:hypothetical protein